MLLQSETVFAESQEWVVTFNREFIYLIYRYIKTNAYAMELHASG